MSCIKNKTQLLLAQQLSSNLDCKINPLRKFILSFQNENCQKQKCFLQKGW